MIQVTVDREAPHSTTTAEPQQQNSSSAAAAGTATPGHTGMRVVERGVAAGYQLLIINRVRPTGCLLVVRLQLL